MSLYEVSVEFKSGYIVYRVNEVIVLDSGALSLLGEEDGQAKQWIHAPGYWTSLEMVAVDE